MSSERKRARIEDSSVTGNQKNGAQMGSEAGVAEEPGTTGFDLLPDEMLVKVFSYLGHGDKLCSRLVNKRWCSVITAWTGFKNSAVYLLKKPRALETLSNSESCCSTIRFEFGGSDVVAKQLEGIRLKDGIANSVLSVELFFCTYSWKSLKAILTMFSNLEALTMILCEDVTEEDESLPEKLVTREDKEKWSVLVKNLRKLKLLDLTTGHIAKALLQFKGLNNLASLQVSFVERKDELEEDASKVVVEHLCQIISASQQTLKSLSIMGEHNKRYLPKLLERTLHPSNLVKFDLRHREDVPYDLSDLQVLQSFLRSQKKLKSVVLPEFRGNKLKDEELRGLLTDLPKTVRSLQVLTNKCLHPDLLDMFPDLAHLSIDTEIRPYVKSDKKYVKMRYLSCDTNVISVLAWVTAFPNLTELHLSHLNTQERATYFNDQALQAIIQNLKRLRCLELSDTCISDFGVTGIRKEYCKTLFDTRALYEEDSYEVPGQYRTGLPLCSLTGLNKLAIYSCMDITDVGIRFGFCFKELRSLWISVNKQCLVQFPTGVTDWGLSYLGKMNPNLEFIHLELNSRSAVSHVGASRFLSRLHRVKSHNHNLKSKDFRSKLRGGKMMNWTGNPPATH